jgi:VWFA-related protein
MIPAVPVAAAERVSADQLEQRMPQWQSLSDGDAAAKIADLELMERFSSTRLTHCLAKLAGPKAQRALIGVADRAAFLAALTAERPALATPDMAEQRRIMGLTASYVSRTVRQLPHLVANRTTTHFESATSVSADVPEDFGALRAMRISRASVQYNDGEETADAAATKISGKHIDADQGLRTWGVFGPILSLVLLDAAQNQLAWSHWEQGPNGPMAVFRYAVARERSHYEVRYCCVVGAYGMERDTFSRMSGYHGEIGVDPQTGTILRLVLEAELDKRDPTSQADLLVEYGPVELGGSTYFCPARSVSISVARTLRSAEDPSGRSYPVNGPPQMLLNHSEFGQYHLFHADTRVLSAEEERAAGMAPDATLPAAQPVAGQADTQPTEEILADAPPASGGAGATGGEAEAPEISAAAATPLPDAAAHPAVPTGEGTDSGFTLHLDARLVDVNVVVLDKKGRPVGGLKPEDFEVYDNGVKQEVKSFSRADGEEAPAPAPQSTPQAAGATTFSNHSGPQAAQAGAAEGNTLVFVVDPANLVYNDLVDARRQMLGFMKRLAPNERVALYVMRYHGFQVLQEATLDHASLAATLAHWTPSAQDLLNARDEEDRNRQTMETVRSPEDLLSVNGNYTLDPQTQQVALDPKLREMGSNPGPNALDVLVDVAQHLAPIPGHKSVVWVTSDNALADWNRMSVSIEKHSKYIEPIALRTQEALNNAHASVYPLDASRLEANVINAEIGNRNVELTPTYQMPPAVEQAEEGTEVQSGIDINKFGQNRDLRPGRLSSQLQQDLRPIEGVFREVAEATGGHAFRRSSNIEGELNGVVAESHATYLLGFSPTAPADGKYHVLTVKLAGHGDVTLRYRTGYQYDKEPTTLKDRFAQAVWQPTDAKDIAISAAPVMDAAGQALRVTVAGTDLDLTQQNIATTKQEMWSGKVDIFLVQRDETGHRAKVTGQTVGLHLKPATYQHAVSDGLTFDQRIQVVPKSAGGSLRVVVVDVNSGRIGSVTVPAGALLAKAN